MSNTPVTMLSAFIILSAASGSAAHAQVGRREPFTPTRKVQFRKGETVQPLIRADARKGAPGVLSDFGGRQRSPGLDERAGTILQQSDFTRSSYDSRVFGHGWRGRSSEIGARRR